MLKNVSIKAKIISFTIIALILLSSIIGIISVISSKEALMKKNYAALTAARDSKIKQIKTFFNERIGDINVLANSADVIELVEDLIHAKEKLHVNANSNYPIDDPLAKEIVNKHDKFFQLYAKEYGYYDIFLISADYGHVMYTQAREADFGANLIKGSLRDSGLGEVFSKVKDLKRPVFVDMKPYAPSNGAPAMFLGAPIYVDGTFESVLVLQISDESINSIMKFREGYGLTQEDYLVGSDKLMRSDSFLDPKNHSLKASFSNPSSGSVDTQAVREAFTGKKETKIIIDYNGNPVLSAFGLVSVGKDLKWAVLSEKDEAEVLIDPNALRDKIIISTVLTLLVITGLVLFIINTTLVKPLNKFQVSLLNFFKYLNREIDDVTMLDDKSNDEIGTMSKVVNENIILTKKGVEEDRRLIDETITVLNEFEQGDLCQRLDITVSNPALMELKTVLNKMGENMENNIDNVLEILEQYSNYNYLQKIDTKNLKEHLLKLASGVNDLGSSITNMLVENKSNGLTLDKSSDLLLENVDKLNQSSTEAAASLEETSAALEEITSTIRINTENVAKMSHYAHNLTDSAREGENLANTTTTAMEEINEQVGAINDAITVIDQIAFQTNILSLNAAVEAATAGEAGKGFAVVAQEVRNLASRSAEAAKEIKDLVENANIKADEGKNISQSMISGYNGLNDNIANTLKLIKDIETASKEQLAGIEQINDAVIQLDRQTQENVSVSNLTHAIAEETDFIAKLVVSNADEKEFEGKDSAKAKVFEEHKQASTSKAPVELKIKQTNARTIPPIPQSGKFKDTSSSDEWESF